MRKCIILLCLCLAIPVFAQSTLELPLTYSQCFPTPVPTLNAAWGPGNGSSCVVRWSAHGQADYTWGCANGKELTHTVYSSTCFCEYFTSAAIALPIYPATCRAANHNYAVFSYYCQQG